MEGVPGSSELPTTIQKKNLFTDYTVKHVTSTVWFYGETLLKLTGSYQNGDVSLSYLRG